MEKEIGSEFWDAPVAEVTNNLFPDSVQWFLSGRSALRAIVRELKGCHTVAMPSWCCDSMIAPFEKEGMTVVFYPVCPSKAGLVQEIRLDCDVLFLMDYFGYAASPVDLSGYNGTIIRDVTHSAFSQSHFGADYCFGSLRKWCGVWTGGFAWAKDGHSLRGDGGDARTYVSLREEAMRQKAVYINQSDSCTDDGEIGKDYLRLYAEAEKFLEDCPITSGTERDALIAKRLDVDYIRTRRRENAQILMKAFQEQLIFPRLGEQDCPLFVPILVSDGQRDALRQFLIRQRIYCPVHWPIDKQSEARHGTLYEGEISLVCDQRYTKNDMNRIVTTVREFWREQRRAQGLYTG